MSGPLPEDPEDPEEPPPEDPEEDLPPGPTIADLPEGWHRMYDDTIEEWDDETGLDATATFGGPWATRGDFLAVVGGTEVEFDYGGGITGTRIIRMRYPSELALHNNVYACNCRINKAGGYAAHAAAGITYDWGIATVRFRTARYAMSGDEALITYNSDSNPQFITRPGTALKFPSDNLRLDRDVALRVPHEDFTLTLHNLPTLNRALYDSLAGVVNNAVFWGRDPGTVHYLGKSHQEQQTVGGVRSWTVTHKFAWRAIPWNMLMRPDGVAVSGSAFEAPVDIATGAKLLGQGNLSALFGN